MEHDLKVLLVDALALEDITPDEIASDEPLTREWMEQFAALNGQLTGELAESDVARALSDPAAFRIWVRRSAALCLAAEGGVR